MIYIQILTILEHIKLKDFYFYEIYSDLLIPVRASDLTSVKPPVPSLASP